MGAQIYRSTEVESVNQRQEVGEFLAYFFRGKMAGFSGVGKEMAEDGEERTMELTIEALTGTVYDLCVSPYETILGIKMKVQRLEGEKLLSRTP